MGPGMFDGLDGMFRVLLWTCAIAVPLGVWKLAEVVVWFIEKLSA